MTVKRSSLIFLVITIMVVAGIPFLVATSYASCASPAKPLSNPEASKISLVTTFKAEGIVTPAVDAIRKKLPDPQQVSPIVDPQNIREKILERRGDALKE